jgi:hypothetical protein
MASVGDAVLISAIVAVSTAVQLVLTSRAKRKEKDQDYAREDAVAARAAEAAKLLSINTAKVAETAQRTSDKLDVIHVLVNSNMTAAMQAELDATVREAAMIQEVMDLKMAAGTQPAVEALAALESARNKITELKAVLAGRSEAAASKK